MNALLKKLENAELRNMNLVINERYFISEDRNDIWKYKKKFSSVVSGFSTFYEIWQGRLIARVFFFWQGWKNKEKINRIVEVQRYLGGSEYKLSRYCYQGRYGTKCLIDYMFYTEDRFKAESEWTKIKNNSLPILKECYWGSYYYREMDVNYFPIHLFERTTKNSVHKYSGFIESRLKEYEVFDYLSLYEKRPQIEMFAKLDLMWALEKNMRYFRWSKKGLAILGLDSKNELKFLKHCPDIGFYRKNKDILQKYNIDTAEKFSIFTQMRYHQVPITSKNIKFLLDTSNQTGLYAVVSMYADYVRFVNELGLPKTNRILYPADLKKTHDELADKIEILNSEGLDKKIKERVTEQLCKLRYANDKFIITPANSIEDLIVESRELNHCVRTYAKKYAEGKTNIFLIRNRGCVNHPFFTLELSDSDEIKQLRGNHNCVPTEPVINFVKQWAKKYKLTDIHV